MMFRHRNVVKMVVQLNPCEPNYLRVFMIRFVIKHPVMGYFKPNDKSNFWTVEDFTEDLGGAYLYKSNENCIARAIVVASSFTNISVETINITTTVDMKLNIDESMRQFVGECDTLDYDTFNNMSDKQYRKYKDSKYSIQRQLTLEDIS